MLCLMVWTLLIYSMLSHVLLCGHVLPEQSLCFASINHWLKCCRMEHGSAQSYKVPSVKKICGGIWVRILNCTALYYLFKTKVYFWCVPLRDGSGISVLWSHRMSKLWEGRDPSFHLPLSLTWMNHSFTVRLSRKSCLYLSLSFPGIGEGAAFEAAGVVCHYILHKHKHGIVLEAT